MNKDKFTIWCEACDHKWTQEQIGLSHIDWECSKCKSDEDTYLIKYEPSDKDFYKREIQLGQGGAKHA